MSITIKAIATTGPKQSELIEMITPDLRPGEALVKTRAIALCTLEQRVFSGGMHLPLPFVGGHEVSGEIAALGKGVNAEIWSPGCRVAVRLLYNCGECYYCRSGKTNLCVKAQRKPVREGLLPGPGGLCDYIIADTDMLFAIPDTLSFEEASLTEPLACCVHSVQRADIKMADDVAVIGGGIMGQYHVMLAKMRGARVILSDMDETRRQLAKKHGADIVIDPGETDPVTFIRSLTQGRGADVVFNTTPFAAVFEQAVEMTGKGGTMVQYSSLHPNLPAQVSPQKIHSSEIILTGSISPSVQDFSIANRLLSGGLVSSKHLIAKTFPFEHAQQALEQAVEPGTLRVIITD